MADHMTEEEILKIQWMFQYNAKECMTSKTSLSSN